jgi:CpXC motif protein
MLNMMGNQVSDHSRGTFQCGNCERHFEATIVTWVDVARTPQARQALLNWQFNVLQCSHCGCRHFSGTPFFYEDFTEGLLVAVFPSIPDGRGELEKSIRSQYGYYPVLEFFYDMTQIWVLLYFQEHYKTNKNLQRMSRIGEGEKRLRAMLRFLKENRLMIDIREKLTETFFEEESDDEIADILGQAVYLLEEMLPWPEDRRCICGVDLTRELSCCGKAIDLEEHEQMLSRHYVIYCPLCKGALSGAGCEACGRVYTWKLGTVASYKGDGGRDHGLSRTADDDQFSAGRNIR